MIEENISMTRSQLKLLLIQTASFAVKHARNETYVGAGAVANRMLDDTDEEVKTHKEYIASVVAEAEQFVALCRK